MSVGVMLVFFLLTENWEAGDRKADYRYVAA